MADPSCPFQFSYKRKVLMCALGEDCASTNEESREICKQTHLFFNKGITAAEIKRMQEKIIREMEKKNISPEKYQVQYKLDKVPQGKQTTPSERSIEDQKKEFLDKIKDHRIRG